ncbi:unnamed protein product [Prorocentrum cordatum]|uniref:DNA (cytosine-5-)-methyltransferase n=1 Tax=Prorocentrum cordatum TaxID=2364126 RepID=A0ABN9UMR8_9DINO|nr:unnamed protein product [Polarella glacialis]
MYHFGHVLRYLGRPLHVIEPCVGLGGFREFCRLPEVSYHSSGAFDFHPSFQGFYDNVNQGTSTPEAKGLRLGPVDGDVMGLPIEELQDAELLLSGPPCQPFAEGGRHGGADDPRSEVYETVVGWVIELAWRGVLVMFLIENSCNMKSYAFFWEMFRRLASCIPFFAIDVVELDLADIYPHRRRRMWLRGMRRDACGHSSLPQPLGRADMQAPLGACPTLLDVLLPGCPNVGPGDLSTDRLRDNMSAYTATIIEDREKGITGTIAVVELDRSPKKVYGTKVMYDVTPPLRCTGPSIFLFSVDDIDLELTKRKVHRFLLDEERFALQGHSYKYHGHFKSQRASRASTGNAYPVPMLVSVMQPMLSQAVRSGALSKKGKVVKCLDELISLVPGEGIVGDAFDELDELGRPTKKAKRQRK